jgi:hypothetical protein
MMPRTTGKLSLQEFLTLPKIVYYKCSFSCWADTGSPLYKGLHN